jgi:hypothetical protein
MASLALAKRIEVCHSMLYALTAQNRKAKSSVDSLVHTATAKGWNLWLLSLVPMIMRGKPFQFSLYVASLWFTRKFQQFEAPGHPVLTILRALQRLEQRVHPNPQELRPAHHTNGECLLHIPLLDRTSLFCKRNIHSNYSIRWESLYRKIEVHIITYTYCNVLKYDTSLVFTGSGILCFQRRFYNRFWFLYPIIVLLFDKKFQLLR